MPLYEYECGQCGCFELIKKFSDPPVTACPTCGREVQKLVSSPAFQFKGSGWYITDYARKGQGDKPNGDKANGDKANGGKTNGGKTESGKESKESKEGSSSSSSKSSESTSSSPQSSTSKDSSASGSSSPK